MMPHHSPHQYHPVWCGHTDSSHTSGSSGTAAITFNHNLLCSNSMLAFRQSRSMVEPCYPHVRGSTEHREPPRCPHSLGTRPGGQESRGAAALTWGSKLTLISLVCASRRMRGWARLYWDFSDTVWDQSKYSFSWNLPEKRSLHHTVTRPEGAAVTEWKPSPL